MIATIMAGNSDNKLPQKLWSELCKELKLLGVAHGVTQFYGHSLPDAEWQNCCLVVSDLSTDTVTSLVNRVANLAGKYNQQSIAVCVSTTTQFIAP